MTGTGPQHFVKNPGAIDAIQWDGSNLREIQAWTGPDIFLLDANGNPGLWVQANQRRLIIEVGAWVAKDGFGFYPIKDEIFRSSYVPANSKYEPALDGIDLTLIRVLVWLMDEFGPLEVKKATDRLYERETHHDLTGQ